MKLPELKLLCKGGRVVLKVDAPSEAIADDEKPISMETSGSSRLASCLDTCINCFISLTHLTNSTLALT